MRPLQLCEEVLPVGCCGLPVSAGPGAIRGGLHALGCRLIAHLLESRQSAGGPRVSATEVLAHLFHLPVVDLGDPVTFFRHTVALVGDLIALLGLHVTLGGHLGPHQSRRVAVEGGLAALGAGALMGSLRLRVASGSAGQIAIRGGLISLRRALVGVSLNLIPIGGALVGVRCGLILVSRGLIGS